MSSQSCEETVALYGWTAVPRDPKVLLSGNLYIHRTNPLMVKDIYFPSDDGLVATIRKYAKAKLSLPTFHHSMRVYYFGQLLPMPTFLLSYITYKRLTKFGLSSLCHTRAAVPRVCHVFVPINFGSDCPSP